jgi:hypothetical protein
MTNGIKPAETVNPFKGVLHRQRIRWGITTLCTVLLLLLTAGGMGKLVTDIVLQGRIPMETSIFMVIGMVELFILIAFGCGQLTIRILRGTWDSWIAELGPGEILMLISNLGKAYKTMTGLEVPRSSTPIR